MKHHKHNQHIHNDAQHMHDECKNNSQIHTSDVPPEESVDNIYTSDAQKIDIDTNMEQNPHMQEEAIHQASIPTDSTNDSTSSDEHIESVKIPRDMHTFPIDFEKTLLELQTLKEQYIHLQADFDNYKKRTRREKEDMVKYASTDMIHKLLPILDHFEIGLKIDTQDTGLLSGFQLIFDQLRDILTSLGLSVIDPHGDAFDPQVHEAMACIHHDSVPVDTVIETVRKGYRLHDKLLRPANVIVSKGKNEE